MLISPQPGARAGAHPAQVVGDLVEADRHGSQLARCLDQPVLRALCLEVVARLRQRQAGALRQHRDRPRGEARRHVDAGADRGAAEGQLRQPGQGGRQALDAGADLGRVAAELLAQRDRRGVHEVRPAGLHHARELVALGLQRLRQMLQCGKEVVDQAGRGGQVDAGREDVVARLAGVDVVVGMDGPSQSLRRQRGDHLVGVHVAAGARAGLKHVDREMVIQLARRHLLGGSSDCLRHVRREDPHLAVDLRGRGLDRPERGDVRGLQALPGDREVLDRALGGGAPLGVARDADLAHRVVLDAVGAALVRRVGRHRAALGVDMRLLDLDEADHRRDEVGQQAGVDVLQDPSARPISSLTKMP